MSALDPSLCCKQTCPVAQRVIQESVYVTRSDILARVREQLINTLARMPAGRRLVVCVPSPTCGSMQWVYVELCHLLPANHLLVCSDNYAPRALPVNTDVLILDDYVLSGHHMLACIEDLLSRERSAHSLTVWIVAAWGTNDSIVSLTEHLVTKPIHQRSGPIHLKLAYPVHPQLKKIAIDKTCACLACEKGQNVDDGAFAFHTDYKVPHACSSFHTLYQALRCQPEDRTFLLDVARRWQELLATHATRMYSRNNEGRIPIKRQLIPFTVRIVEHTTVLLRLKSISCSAAKWQT
jgi:hypothetical protein